MSNKLLTNYTEITFLDKIKESLKTCEEFYFSVSFIKKAGLILLLEDIKKALEYYNSSSFVAVRNYRAKADDKEVILQCNLIVFESTK